MLKEWQERYAKLLEARSKVKQDWDDPVFKSINDELIRLRTDAEKISVLKTTEIGYQAVLQFQQMSNFIVALKVHKAIKLHEDSYNGKGYDKDQDECYREAFDGDFLWYPFRLADGNDLEAWCDAVLSGQGERDFFI